MGFLTKSCTKILTIAMLLSLIPGIRASAAETGFDAYRKPFLSGPVQTWVYQGEDYGRNRNKVFADDQEDGDLTAQIKQTGTVDTSRPGTYTVTYQVTDSDGNQAELTTKVTVLAASDKDTAAKKIQRKLYTLPDASHLTDIGFNRGYYHDRQSLGIWLPADAQLKVRLVNFAEFGKNLELKLLNNDSLTEKVSQNTGGSWSDPADSVNIPANGDWITVKNCYTEENISKSTDSVPFIYTPKDTTVQPVIEIEWNDSLMELPYYRYQDDEKAFFSEWDQSKAPYAVIEGQAATFLVPIKDRNRIINYPNTSEPYRFQSIDEMLEWSAAFVKQYDAYAGLDFYASEPYNQNVRAKFFIKANKHGVGLAYYSSDHSANNDDNLGDYLCRNWVSLHEFGHGYEGAIATQENSFVETTNNIMGYYFEPTYRPETDFGWLLDGKGKTKLEAFNYLGRTAEEKRNSVSTFNDLTEGQKLYDLTLYMFTNLLDRIGPQKTVAAMHTQYRKYYYENRKNTSSSDVIIDSFSRTGGYNVAPYFDGWHIHASELLEDQLYDQDLPMLYYLRNLIPDDAAAEQARQQLNAAGMSLDGIYSLVSTDDLAKLSVNYTSNVTLKLSIDDFSAIEGKSIRIKNGSKIAAQIPIDKKELNINLPIGIYEVELPLPRTGNYRYGNEYLVASNGNAVKELAYTKVTGNPLADDAQMKLLGMGDAEVAVLTLDTSQNKLNCRINNIEPHLYFTNPEEPYITICIKDPQGRELFRRSLSGVGKAEAFNGDFDFPEGSKAEITHLEINRLRVVSQYTEETIPEFGISGTNTAVFVRTAQGLMPEQWGQEQRNSAYHSMLNAYSDFMMQHMSLEDAVLTERFHNAKLVVSAAYDILDAASKESYRQAYGILIGEDLGTYIGHKKIDSGLLKGEADSWQDEGENAVANALDGNENTMWHSNYAGEDILGQKNNTYTIILPENMDVGRLEYVPRKSGNNGMILSYALSYSTEESGNNFTEIPLESNIWAEDSTTKGVDFYAPNARRIRIAALSTAGVGGTNKFISAAEFYLYEAYEVLTPNTYLSDLYLSDSNTAVKKYRNGEAVSLVVNGKEKSFTAGIGMEAGASAVWDLDGKHLDAFAAWAGVDASLTKNDQASVAIYGDGRLLYQSGVLAGKDTAESVYLDITGVKELKAVATGLGGNALIVLADARLLGSEDQTEVALIEGESIAVQKNLSLTPPDRGKVTWSSSNPAAATVSGGIVTAVSEGNSDITARYSDGSVLTCRVQVKKAPASLPPDIPDPDDGNNQTNGNPTEQPPAEDKITYPKVGTKKTIGGLVYQIKTSGDSSKTVAVVKASKKKKYTIPASVNISGTIYQVTEIGAKAFLGNQKLTQVTIGKNVTKIGKQAFKGCVKLKKITIKSKKLKSVGKNAFLKISAKAKITVPKNKKKSYQKLFKTAKLSSSVRVI